MDEDRPPSPDTESADAEMGEPLTELTQVQLAPAPGFLKRIRNGIDRRRLGSELADLSWHGVLAVFLEYLDLVFGILPRSDNPGKGDR